MSGQAKWYQMLAAGTALLCAANAHAVILKCKATSWTADYDDSVAGKVNGLFQIDEKGFWQKWSEGDGQWKNFGCQVTNFWNCEITPNYYRRTELARHKNDTEQTLTIDRHTGKIIYKSNYPAPYELDVIGQCELGETPKIAAPKF